MREKTRCPGVSVTPIHPQKPTKVVGMPLVGARAATDAAMEERSFIVRTEPTPFERLQRVQQLLLRLRLGALGPTAGELLGSGD